MTDKELLEYLRSCNEKSLTSAYLEHRDFFAKYFKGYFKKNEEDIADLYQDSFTVLWRDVISGKISEGNLKCRVSTYLVAVGKRMMFARDRKFREIADDEQIAMTLGTQEYDEQEILESAERKSVIREAVDNLPEPCSSILDKYYWDGLSGKEIAEDIGSKNSDVVKTQKNRCMRKLKAYLKIKGIE